MKTKLFNITVVLSFFLNIFLTSNLLASNDDVCGTTANITGNSIPTSGTIKVFIVFAQFLDDPNTTTTGWARNTYPDWANTFVNAVPNGSSPWNNLSHYYNEMSNGTYQVVGDVYNSLVVTDHNESYYNSIGQVNREILLEVDQYVDFSEYDNLNGNSFGSDGKVDFIYIIYRNATVFMQSYTGIAHLEVSQTIYADGKQIVSNGSIGSGVQQRGGFNGQEYTMYASAHEMGHYLFGGNHIENVTNLALMTRGPVWNGSRGMHSWERQKLGWISYTDKSTDGSVTLSDYMTEDQVYRVPINNNEYFLIENRKKYSPHDKAGDVGFYIYRVTDASYFPPTIDVQCADGKWNFAYNSNTNTITRTTPNINGYDEMEPIYINGVSYACYTPIYYENAAWGDNEDAFDLTFNNVYSPVSNPRTTNYENLEFSLEVTGLNQMTFYFDNDGSGDEYAGKPFKPQSFAATFTGSNPILTWNANLEPDMSSYKIYYMVEGETGWGQIATVPHVQNVSSYSWTDYSVVPGTKWDSKNYIHYKVAAVDNTAKESICSDESKVYGHPTLLWKTANGKDNQTEVKEYGLQQNYPNPFNPSTEISYQIPAKGFITLKVYDMLGNEVSTLVNEWQEQGSYSAQFTTSGKQLASGMYFYTLTAGKFTDTKKFILLK